MAISSSVGIISGLNVDSIVSGLMAMEKLPLQRLQTKKTTVGNQISAMGKIKSSIAALQQAAENISKTSSLYAYKGKLANTDIASATTTSAAVGGTYSIEVERLATHHKLMSSTTVDPSAGGSLTIEIGSTASGSFVAKSGTSPVAVTINAGASLSDVAKSINDADAGVSATIINGQSGPQLVLTSQDTGETNQIKITSSISGLGFDPTLPATAGNMTEATQAQNAILKIDGITIANTTSNTVTNAITGVTLTLTKTNDNDPTQLVISNDTSEVESKLKAFVDAYNSARSTMKDLSKYDSTGANTGILNGDSTVSSAVNQLRSLLSTVPAGVDSSYQYLSDLGIESTGDGTLKLDSTKLQAALKTDFAAVATSVAAYGTAFDSLTTKMNESEGLIAARLDGLNSSSSSLTSRIEGEERRVKQVQTRYESQFAALETLLASMQTTSTYLTQQLSSLSSLSNRSS